jgi:glycosyltransferase involved in cell wall biosynthesis
MRIGFFTSVDGWGGSEIYLRSLMMRIGDMGHEVVLFGIKGTRLFSEATEAGIKCVSWKRSRRMGPVHTGEVCKGNNRAQNGRRLKDYMRRILPSGVTLVLRRCREVVNLLHLFSHEPVDVMHVNIHVCEVAGIACRLCGIPSVGMCCLFPAEHEGRLTYWLTRSTTRLCSAVASKSRACINAWQAYCNLPAHKCRFIWNGVDLKEFKYQKREGRVPGRPFRILTVARLSPMKGLDVLIRAMKLLQDENLILSIAGHGERKDEEDLKRLVADMNLSSKVRFLGYVEDPGALYRQTDCTVLASVTHESFGQTLIEAMASGSPLITSDFGPFPEINVHNVTGLVVPTGNPSGLATAIRRMMEDEGSRIQMGRCARERVERLFPMGRMIDETVNLYAELAQKP